MQGGHPRDVIHLTNAQSVRVHGWFNPKRTLSWADIVSTPHMTFRHLHKSGVSTKQLKQLQPDVSAWVNERHVSFEDVPIMLEWPLHPIRDLKGNLSVLVEHKYDYKTLMELGLNFEVLQKLGLNVEWMKMMDLSLRDWMNLGMTSADTHGMSEKEIATLFGTNKHNLGLCMAMTENAALLSGT